MAIKWNIERVKEKCIELGIECLEEKYVNVKTKMKFVCGCGKNTFSRSWEKVLLRNQIKCEECSGIIKWDIEKVKGKCKALGFECLEEDYIDSATPMRFKCSCGKEFSTKWAYVLMDNKIKCDKCSGRTNWNNDSVDKKCKELGIKRVSDYTRMMDKMEFIGICGHHYKTSWKKVVDRNQIECQECARKRKESKACTNITLELQKNNIEFLKEYRIENCKNKKALPFDFAIFKDGALLFLLEYDGEQHFNLKKAWGGKEALENSKLRDSIKDKYCEENNITLYRINYKENEIEELKEILKKEKLL